jgi:hypothetical protein
MSVTSGLSSPLLATGEPWAGRLSSSSPAPAAPPPAGCELDGSLAGTGGFAPKFSPAPALHKYSHLHRNYKVCTRITRCYEGSGVSDAPE